MKLNINWPPAIRWHQTDPDPQHEDLHLRYPHLIQPIPRRPRIASNQEKPNTPFTPVTEIEPSWFAILSRIVVWILGILAFFASKHYGKVVGRSSEYHDARRLRMILTRMGTTAVKAGQQLSVRADMLPEEFCRELAKLLDRMEPFPFGQAIQIIEHTLQRPLDQIFRTLDPVPIGSASIACVYQAELLDGTKVAVKIKRPNIATQIQIDLKAIGVIFSIIEATGAVRSGLTRHLRVELERMVTEELNFVLEARYTEIFRRTSRKNPYVSAPRIYNEYCSNEVIVSEFVSGVFLSEIIDAINNGNQQVIANLIERGFNFKKIGCRMMRVLHWECYETLFFHADPHPANLIVRPDNTIVMIDFGSCGSVSETMKRKLMTFHRQMLKNDVHGMSQTLLSILEPLPHCDTYSLTNDLIRIFRSLLISNESKHASWQEKCTGWMWMQIIALTRKYSIPMNLDTLRVFRATFMYDTIIYQLHPQIDPRKEFKKWAYQYHKRTRKEVIRSLSARQLGPLNSDYQTLAEAANLGSRVIERVQKFLDSPKYNFGYSVGKVSYVISTITRTLLSSLKLFLLFIAVKSTHLYYTNQIDFSTVPDFQYMVSMIFGDRHFLYFAFFLAIIFWIRIHSIILRLDEVETD